MDINNPSIYFKNKKVLKRFAKQLDNLLNIIVQSFNVLTSRKLINLQTWIGLVHTGLGMIYKQNMNYAYFINIFLFKKN